MQEKYFIYGNNIINSIYSCLIVRQQRSIHILSLQRPLPSFIILFEKGSSITYDSRLIDGSPEINGIKLMVPSHNLEDFACKSSVFSLLHGCLIFREDYRNLEIHVLQHVSSKNGIYGLRI